jgi:L-rhamnose isomerase
MSSRYESAKEIYASYGIDTDEVIRKLKEVPLSVHCWQGDDVIGFDHDGPLTGGIQTTGNYPGKAYGQGHVPLPRQEEAESARMLCYL